MLNEQEIRLNLIAVENAVAQQRLEGLEVPLDIIGEMQRAARGEIAIEDGIRSTYEKFAHGEIRVRGSILCS
ncbi:MAG: antitoxin VbhA family protein [Gammaproteobacteria bacterium]|nr:antitoxin VbhA family protein [Gammaproteobacteria bacterium]